VKTAYNHTKTTGTFPNGKTINYRVRAKNKVDYGAYSTILSVLCDSTPLFMGPPIVDYLGNNINPNWIYITWASIADTDVEKNGRDAISWYGIEWDQGTDSWANLTSFDTSPSSVLFFNLSAPTPPFTSNMSV
jgi:hypothetical protein